MDGNKLELTAKPSADQPASYKPIPEADMEEDAVARPKSLVKSKPTTPEVDGADEKMLPKEDTVELKTSPNEKQNGDAKLDIGDVKNAFVGLTKEELMKYATDPFWVRLRWFLFITFWLLWGLMLLGAVMIILAAPKCNPPPPRTWWEKGPIAEVNQEANPEEEIEKITKLGAKAVVLSWSEDVYKNFDEKHEFIKSIEQYKLKNLKVIVEIEPGFSQVWFNKSQYGDPEFSDYYIWQPPKENSNGEPPIPPNNWHSIKNKSSWIYSDVRKEFYYAPSDFPHLNFRNQNVTDEFTKVIKKLLSYGAGGIRVKGAPNLLVNDKFTDESHVPNPGACVLTDYCFYIHTQTENINDLAPLLKQWRDTVKNLTDNGPFMISEELSSNIEAYKVNSSYVIDLPLQSHLFFKPEVTVSNVVHAIETALTANNLTWPLWKANSTSEWDMVTYLLPGTPLITSDALDNTELLKMRDSSTIMRGSFKAYALQNETVLAFIREQSGNPGTLVAFNPTDNRVIVNFPGYIKTVSEDVTVLLRSTNYNETDIVVNKKYDATKLPISPKSAIALSYVPKSIEE